MIPLSRPPPQLVYPYLSLSFLLQSQVHTCHLISDALTPPPHKMLPITPSQISRSIHLSPGSPLISFPPPPPQLNSTHLGFSLPSSPHWTQHNFPCAYSRLRLPSVPRPSPVPFHETIYILPAPALTSPTTSESIQLHVLYHVSMLSRRASWFFLSSITP